MNRRSFFGVLALLPFARQKPRRKTLLRGGKVVQYTHAGYIAVDDAKFLAIRWMPLTEMSRIYSIPEGVL